MQRYWAKIELQASDKTILTYSYAREAKDAIARAKAKAERHKDKVVRVWIAFLEAETPVFTLVFGDTHPEFGNSMELDAVSLSVANTYKERNGKKKKKKGVIPRPAPAPAVKTEQKPFVSASPYTIVWSGDYEATRNHS